MIDPLNTVVYQLKVALRGISPLIWRRLLISAETSIAEFHHILQLVLGWTNVHLHRFLIHGKEYGIAYDGDMSFADNPQQVKLGDFCFRLRERFVYEYDFNDHWQHDIRVEQIVTADPHRTYPSALGASGRLHQKSAEESQYMEPSGDGGSMTFSLNSSKRVKRTPSETPGQPRRRTSTNQAITLSISIAVR